MTKTQGWIIIWILVVAVVGAGIAYDIYYNNQRNATGEEGAYCLNQCNVQVQNGSFQNNSCFTNCLEEKGITFPGYDTGAPSTSQ